MEQKLAQEKLDLISNEVQKFRENSSNVHDDGVGNLLVDKLMKILQHGQVQTKEKEEENSSFQTDSSPDQKAMTNSVVVREIMRYMNTLTLLTLREVSRLWRDEATSHLLSPRHENSLTVKFKWLDTYGNFRCKESILPEFMENVLKYSEKFPCSQFIFNRGRLTDNGLVQFFSDFGVHVQQLTLNTEYLETNTLRNILFKWTPNLKSLVLKPNQWTTLRNTMSCTPETSPQHHHHHVLNKLKKITLPAATPFKTIRGRDSIHEILTCAPNLTCIEDPTLSFIPQIISAGKFSLVKTLTWDFMNNSQLLHNFINFINFAATGPHQLTSLILEDIVETVDVVGIYSQLMPALHSLLQLGQNTLEVIEGIHILSKMPADPAFKIPPLPKVTQIKLDTMFQSHILPQDYTLSEILPNLNSISIVFNLLIFC